MNKIYKPSIFRIITNATFNCIMIVFMILISLEFFVPVTEKYLRVMSILLEVMGLVAIILFTITEYKFSYISIDKNGINHVSLSSKKKSVMIPFDVIKDLKVESYSLKIYYMDKKLTIDYYKEYKEIKEILEKQINKQ